MKAIRTAAVLAGAALLVAACGSAHAGQTFHPTGTTSSAPATSAPAHSATTGGLAWPPFGHQVHVVMPGWLPGQRSEAAAVVANKNFLLALLYAEYRGDRDHRWRAYVRTTLRPALSAQLSQPDVTTQSFTGTIRFSHMSAFPDPAHKHAIDVAQCFDNSHSVNTSIHTGRPVPDNTPADQHYYRTTNVLSRGSDGTWQVIAMYPAIYYPRVPECKP